ncbi:MAG: peptidoglycan recognition protein family protein [Acetobacter sp.]|nr:peptidoglycan recognition protein family protein [Acetobacter sp.]
MTSIQKPQLKFDIKQMKTRPLNKIFLIILHHSCGTGSVEDIHKLHRERNGWAGIGYHYYIRTDGTIYAGRPIEYIGAHCPSNNQYSIGICLEGDFRKTNPTEEQIQSGKELINWLKKDYPSIKRVLNHNDLYATLCPVVNLKGILK